ncbi:MAG: hypothetical protein OXC93_12045 [Rhodospirillaceae bacterium]|nr:hypothetical protein [Rhodospirillaceae bacterium]
MTDWVLSGELPTSTTPVDVSLDSLINDLPQRLSNQIATATAHSS